MLHPLLLLTLPQEALHPLPLTYPMESFWGDWTTSLRPQPFPSPSAHRSRAAGFFGVLPATGTAAARRNLPDTLRTPGDAILTTNSFSPQPVLRLLSGKESCLK